MSHTYRRRQHTDRRCRYNEIRSLYIEQLAFNLMEDSTTETTRASVEKKIDSFVEGGLEHTAEVLSTLWEILNKDGDVKPPSNVIVSSPQFPTLRLMGGTHFCKNWSSWGRKKKKYPKAAKSMRLVATKTLTKSIRTGVFFDRKYWARDGNALKPVYFSSTIMNNDLQGLNECA